MDKRELKITSDGSHTLYIPELDETYHSTHGAIQEAIHVFINAGMGYFKNKKELSILEIGFGTGLNTFLTVLETSKTLKNVNYTAIEAYPLKEEIVNQLNYTKELNNNVDECDIFHKIHTVNWEKKHNITNNFSLTKSKLDLTTQIVTGKYDLIYFDAFGPRAQPEMWSLPIFKNLYNSLIEGGIITTYCAKGSVKRTLKEVGFEIENLPGPPGKREMTRAVKNY